MTFRQGQCGVGSHHYLLNAEKTEELRLRHLLCQVGQFTLLSHGHIMDLSVSYQAILQTLAAGLATLSSFHCFHSCQLSFDRSRRCV